MPILAYHKINNRIELGLNNVSIDSFEKHVRYLHTQNYYTISLYEYLYEKYEINDKRHPIILTFDDADVSVYKNAFPILKSFDFRATLFVISDFVGRQNSWDFNFGRNLSNHLNWHQLRVLSDNGWEIGSHTATHPDLTKLTGEDLQHEVESSKKILADKLSQQIHFISYPFNRYDERVIRVVRNAGYTGGCALHVRNKMNGEYKNYNLKRSGVYSIDGIKNIKQKLNDSSFEQVKQRVINFCSRGTVWYNQIRN